MSGYRVLLVDDDEMVCLSLGRNLARHGYEVTTADSGHEALALLERERFDIVVSDLVMRRPDGLSILERTKALRPDTAFILMTGFGDLDSAIQAIRLGADDYINKPCEADDLAEHINRCVQKQETALNLMRTLRSHDHLLRETHHRVKNDFLMINGLVNLEMAQVKADDDRALFQALKSRVQVLALVHEQLQLGKDYGRVQVVPFVRDLCHRVAETFNSSGAEVTVISTSSEVQLPPEMAVPLGLVVNELVANSLVHAFEPARRGKVTVEIAEGEEGHRIVVRDDGRGLPGDFDLDSVQTLGFRLVTALVSQLRGTIRYDREQGSTFVLDIPRSNNYPGAGP